MTDLHYRQPALVMIHVPVCSMVSSESGDPSGKISDNNNFGNQCFIGITILLYSQ